MKVIVSQPYLLCALVSLDQFFVDEDPVQVLSVLLTF